MAGVLKFLKFFLFVHFVKGNDSSIISTFVTPNSTNNNHLVVNKFTGVVYLGAVNRIYQLNSKLEVTSILSVGPFEDDVNCVGYRDRVCSQDSVEYEKKKTDNFNKVLVIDYEQSKLIHCGSVFQGVCSITDLNEDLSTAQVEIVDKAIAANDENSSTTAFIARGPGDTLVLNVATSFTGNSKYRHDIPSVSSRKLIVEKSTVQDDTVDLLDYAGRGGKAKIFIRDRHFKVEYVYGFQSKGFSYFLSIQKKDHQPRSPYISKLIRICQHDPSYKSYAEIPIDCKNQFHSNRRYSLVQSAYLFKAGIELAKDLEDAEKDDVLYASFATASTYGNFKPNLSGDSALCIFPMRDIRKQFQDSIQACFDGRGNRGLDFIKTDAPCVLHSTDIPEDFCGSNINSPFGGQSPILGTAVATFNSLLISAVAVTTVNDLTIAFLGTNEGEIKKLVIENLEKAYTYDSVIIDQGQTIKSDLVFDPSGHHLYVLTGRKVTKILVHSTCKRLTSCTDCVQSKDPFCGWCGGQNRCTVMASCASPSGGFNDWISYQDSEKCPGSSTEPIHCPDLAKTCTTCSALSAKLECGWCLRKQSCVKEKHCPGDNSWLSSGHNCTNPQIISFHPKSGPIEGGTLLNINVINLDKELKRKDLYLVISVAGVQCTVVTRRPTMPPGQISCFVRKDVSISPGRSGPIIIRSQGFLLESADNFIFVNMKIYQISPTTGPLRGGTNLRIFGENLDAGREMLAFVGEVGCRVTKRDNETIYCTTGSFEERGTFGVSIRIDDNEKVLPPVFSYLDNPVILKNRHTVVHGSLRGGGHVTIEGRHFDGVQVAHFIVTHNNTDYIGLCNITTPETIQCLTPKIDQDPEMLLPESEVSASSNGDSEDENVLVLPYRFQLDNVDTWVANLSEDKHQFFLRLGSAHHEETSSSHLTAVLLTMTLTLLIVGVLAFILFKRYQRKKRRSRQNVLSGNEMEDFRNGKPKFIEKGVLPAENPYIIPYNQRFEVSERRFSMDIDDVLGAGAFGLVTRGTIDGKPCAVKTLKSDAEKMHLVALMSEVKILIHLGNSGGHKNIVNLIGAYTKYINKGQLYIFVELCPLGSLDKYLRSRRDHFVNQIEEDAIVLTASADRYENVDPADILCTLDLLNYSHQTASAMEFLTEKKIIHADLATRNLLLYNKTTIKVTDFGLARKLYDYTNYVKKHQEPLPWRWMAIESLKDLSFSSHSDVWAYGVTLWEMFTLGDLPYPGLSWTIDFTERLQRGLHNTKPKFATSDIYNTMLECWRLKPEDRPSFSDIEKFFSAVLSELTNSQVNEQKKDEQDPDGYLVPLLSGSTQV